MAAIAHLTPYLNRLVTLLQKNASAKLEIHCKSGHLSVNFSHEIGSVEETPAKTSSTYSDVLKSNSKLKRLKKRAAERAEKANNQTDGTEKTTNITLDAEIETPCKTEQANYNVLKKNSKLVGLKSRATERAEEANKKTYVAEKTTKNTSDAATETHYEAEQANHNVTQQTGKAECGDEVEIQCKAEQAKQNVSQVNIKTKTNDEKAKKRKNNGKNENNQKTNDKQKKFPKGQVSKNN